MDGTGQWMQQCESGPYPLSKNLNQPTHELLYSPHKWISQTKEGRKEDQRKIENTNTIVFRLHTYHTIIFFLTFLPSRLYTFDLLPYFIFSSFSHILCDNLPLKAKNGEHDGKIVLSNTHQVTTTLQCITLQYVWPSYDKPIF